MGAAAAVSIERLRRRRGDAVVAADPLAGLVGSELCHVERRYGLMTTRERIVVSAVVGTSGDLAVADRLAFVAATQEHQAMAVLCVDGWYVACATERSLTVADLAQLAQEPGAPRIMSLVTERGITPALGPLVA